MGELPSSLVALHLMDLQTQIQMQSRCLRRMVQAISDGRIDSARAELEDMAARAQLMAQSVSAVRQEVEQATGTPQPAPSTFAVKP